MSNVEYRVVIKFFIRKGLDATAISNELDSVHKDDAPSYNTVTKWVAESKDSERDLAGTPPTAAHPVSPLTKTLKT